LTQLATKANSLVIAAFVMLLGLAALLYTRYDAEVGTAQGWVEHTYRVLGDIKDLMLAVQDAETGQRGYLLTGRDEYLTPYGQGRDRAGLLFGELKELTADNPQQQERLQGLSAQIQQKLDQSSPYFPLVQPAQAIVGSANLTGARPPPPVGSNPNARAPSAR